MVAYFVRLLTIAGLLAWVFAPCCIALWWRLLTRSTVGMCDRHQKERARWIRLFKKNPGLPWRLKMAVMLDFILDLAARAFEMPFTVIGVVLARVFGWTWRPWWWGAWSCRPCGPRFGRRRILGALSRGFPHLIGSSIPLPARARLAGAWGVASRETPAR